MTRDLLNEIKQKKPFAHPEEELFLSLLRTSDLLGRKPCGLLKEKNLSPAQYNVLRILRGAEPEGLPCGDIAARMITRDPDITRILDRLEKRHWVARGRGPKDRRVVKTHITEAGLALIKTLDQVMADIHLQQLRILGARAIQSMLRRLAGVREHLE